MANRQNGKREKTTGTEGTRKTEAENGYIKASCLCCVLARPTHPGACVGVVETLRREHVCV